VTLCV